jgi:hypothetical protein
MPTGPEPTPQTQMPASSYPGKKAPEPSSPPGTDRPGSHDPWLPPLLRLCHRDMNGARMSSQSANCNAILSTN